MRDALIAVGTSLLVGAITTRYVEYAYWRAWAPRAFGFGMLLLAVVYAAAGLAGFGLFSFLNGAPDSASAAGVDGLAGHAALRARWSRVGAGEEGGASLLSLIRGWLLDWLGTRAGHGVETRVRRLSDDRLVELTFDLFWIHVDRPDADKAALAQLHGNLVDAAAALGHGGAAAADGRGRLRGFCCHEIGTQQLRTTEEYE